MELRHRHRYEYDDTENKVDIKLDDEDKYVGMHSEKSRIENGIFIQEHSDSLWKIHSALRFSGGSFLILGATQLIFESTVIASLDEFAFGIFLLDAAHRIRRLAANLAQISAAEEMHSSLISIGDTHSILAWVTSYQTFRIISIFFGLEQLALSSKYYQYITISFQQISTDFPILLIFLKVSLALLGLRFGGLRYFRSKISYWSRASSLGAYLLNDKVARLLGRRPNVNRGRLRPSASGSKVSAYSGGAKTL
uniref:Uncharacterized protein n=1 Tax=Aureoumbra lagunensis TaxID=44058 RepID=A0A7S3NNS3_9STRA|mmetsp:Transcript_18037/g.23525  ORF Transcript_18037/g.23525 Transcript_18037/m.23525 type:complete len:252 (+) Transcript_18037:48-803(+)